MKSLLVVNQKGGVGKTALVVNLAHFFAKAGRKVVVIDLDTQANSSFSFQEFNSGIAASALFNGKTALPPVRDGISLIAGDDALADIDVNLNLATAAKNFQRKIAALDQAGFDLCLIDAPSALGVRVLSALLAADYVVAPIELEAYSIYGVQKLLAVIHNAQKSNPDLKFLGMLVNRMDRRNQRHVEHLAELTGHYGGLVIPLTIGLRSSIAESLVTGEPIWLNKKTAARAARNEMQAVAEYILEKMEN